MIISNKVESLSGATAIRSIEEWTLVINNVYNEASEEDITNLFREYGEVKNLYLHLDRRSGYTKVCCLIPHPSRFIHVYPEH